MKRSDKSTADALKLMQYPHPNNRRIASVACDCCDGMTCEIRSRNAVPNGHDSERKSVWQRSRIWGVVWDIGDAAYYTGLLASLIVPATFVGRGIYRSEPWGDFLRNCGLALLALVLCYKSVVNRVGVPNMIATVCHQLGLDHRRVQFPQGGRLETPSNVTVTGAKVVGDLLSNRVHGS